MNQYFISQAIYGLDAWFETMRNERGYCGPVTHWWQSCLLYCGAMADWRYEGLICGYSNLYRMTHQALWLERAITAGQDLLRAQLPNGQFLNSGFEEGSIEGSTPHEAAVDLALLELASLLHSLGDERFRTFFSAAERNLKEYQLKCLWNGKAFRDQAWNQTLVPNKNATTMEALLLYEELSGCSMEAQIVGAADLILSAQVKAEGPRQGATIHLGTGAHQLVIGIYTARCATALLRLYHRYPNPKYLRAAKEMGLFLQRLVVDEGTIFGFYANDRAIVCPTWIGASGDILRALITLRPYASLSNEVEQITTLLRKRQLPSGGIPTASGLGHKGATSRYAGLPDFRDVLPVVGWCDKAFRALTMLVSSSEMQASIKKESLTSFPLHESAIECIWKRKRCLFKENDKKMQLLDLNRHKVIYSWRKGECYPHIYQL